MTGLLAGILLSRVFSGALAEYAGWRSVYALAALGVLPITLAIWHMLPRLRPHNALSYPHAALAGASVGRVSRAAARNAGARFSVIGLQRFLVNAGVDAGERYQIGSAAGAFGLAGRRVRWRPRWREVWPIGTALTP